MSVKIRILLVMMIFDDLCFSCLKKSKKFVQTCMRRSELFLQTSIRMTLPSARRTCRSFFHTQTSSSTVPLPCALMTTSGTVQVPFHDLYYTCVCTCMCKFLHYFSLKKKRYSQWKQRSKSFLESYHPQITI